MSDYEMIEELKKENAKALCLLIDRYGNYVAKILYGFLGSGLTAQDLEEISSDVFFVLWQQRHKLESDKNLKAYIAAIAKNTGRKRLRKWKAVEPFSDELEPLSASLSTEETVELSEKQQKVLSLIASMQMPDKGIFYRYYYLEQTTGEIAKLMRLNRSTVMSKLARGRHVLKMKIGGARNEY